MSAQATAGDGRGAFDVLSGCTGKGHGLAPSLTDTLVCIHAVMAVLHQSVLPYRGLQSTKRNGP